MGFDLIDHILFQQFTFEEFHRFLGPDCLRCGPAELPVFAPQLSNFVEQSSLEHPVDTLLYPLVQGASVPDQNDRMA